MAITIMFFSVIGAFAVGLGVGVSVSDGYISRRTCRECRRNIVKQGFSSDGKNYEVRLVSLDSAKKN